MINSTIRIEPRVIQHLGQDLITAPEVAVTELLKNSIDARSTKINIHIFNAYSECLNSPCFLSPLPDIFSNYISCELSNIPPTIKLRFKARQPAASFSISKPKLLE